MRVLVIAKGCDRSEAAIYKGMVNAGVDLDMVATPDTLYQDELFRAGVRVFPLKIRHRFDLGAILKIRSILKSDQYDIIYAPANHPLAVALFASRGMAVKVVGYRGTIGHLSRWDPACLVTYLHPRIDNIICVSNAVREYLLSVDIPAHKLTTIYKGHDIHWYDETPPVDMVDFNIPEGAFIVGFTGNMRPVKGIPVLLESLRYIPEQIPVYLVCIGRVLDRRINRMLRDPQIKARAHFTGFIPQASRFARTFDCMVMPSLKREGLPRAIIEAMAQDIPVVVTDVGGMPELVHDNCDGLIVPANDPHALARAIIQIYEDPSFRKHLTENALKSIKEKFNIQTTIKEVIGLFERLIACKDNPV
jgi:glycosyltransferase involved in cell wall biosynthesis